MGSRNLASTGETRGRRTAAKGFLAILPSRTPPPHQLLGNRVHLPNGGLGETLGTELGHKPLNRAGPHVLHWQPAQVAADDVGSGKPGVEDLRRCLAVRGGQTGLQPACREHTERVVSSRAADPASTRDSISRSFPLTSFFVVPTTRARLARPVTGSS